MTNKRKKVKKAVYGPQLLRHNNSINKQLLSVRP